MTESSASPVFSLEKQPLTQTKIFTFTQNELERIKNKLLICINALTENPSVFTQIAKLWDNRPWWQKIALGSLIVVPLLLAGLVAHVAVLIALSFSFLFYFTLSSWLLDNHHQNQSTHNQEMKITILGLVDVLAHIILELESSSKKLNDEIQHLHDENQKLSTYNTDLEQQITTFKDTLTHLTQQEQLISASQKSLQATVDSLEITISTKTDLLQKNELALIQMQSDCALLKKQLSQKIVELSDVKVSMELEVKQGKQVIAGLNQSVQILSVNVITDARQRASYLERLTEFLNNTESSFASITEQAVAVERKLALVTSELEESQRRLKELLDRQEKQVIQLEKKTQAESQPSLTTSIKALATDGLFAIKPKPAIDTVHQLVVAAAAG